MTRAAPPPERPEFRTPQVTVYTGDIGRSLQFYRDLLGFTESFRTPTEGTPSRVELRLGHFVLGLTARDARTRDLGGASDGPSAHTEIVVWAEDVDAAHDWLLAHGARSLAAPRDVTAALRAAEIADPDGNPVQLVQRRARPDPERR